MLVSGVHTVYGTTYDGEAMMFASSTGNECSEAQGGDSRGVYATSYSPKLAKGYYLSLHISKLKRDVLREEWAGT